jgi:hypothetical protein
MLDFVYWQIVGENTALTDYEERVLRIIEVFDWEKIHNCMIHLNLRWYTDEEEYVVPTIPEMIKLVKRLFQELIETNTFYLACGGFVAERYKDTKHPKLLFVLEDSVY